MAWDKTLPASSTLISASDALIRANWSAIQSGDVTSTEKVRLDERVALSLSANPTEGGADRGYLYCTNVNSKGELHYLDEDSTAVQLTNAGKIYSNVVRS